LVVALLIVALGIVLGIQIMSRYRGNRSNANVTSNRAASGGAAQSDSVAKTSPALAIGIRPPAFTVQTQFEAKQTQDQLTFRLRTLQPLPSPPVVELRAEPEAKVRSINMVFDSSSNSYVGAIDTLPVVGTGRLEIKLTDDKNQVESHFTGFAIRPLNTKRLAATHSHDGQMSIFTQPSALPDQSRILVSATGEPAVPLPSGVKLIAGYYHAAVIDHPDAPLEGTVAIQLPAGRADSTSNSYVIHWLDPSVGAWKPLKTVVQETSHQAQANSAGPGAYALTVMSSGGNK
jgi:hypothetical protein